MSVFLRCYLSEIIKHRKHWTIVVSVLAPFCQTTLLGMLFWFSEGVVFRFRPGAHFWIELSYLAWNLLFLPVLVALLTEFSWDLESNSKTWNHLLIQPIPRRMHYISKLLAHTTLAFLSQLLLVFLLLIGSMFLNKNIAAHWGSIPWALLGKFSAFSLLASLPIIVFHTWLSMRFPGLWLAILVAVGFIWIGTALVSNRVLIQVLPWGMASYGLVLFERWQRHFPWALFPGSILSALFIAYLSILDFARFRKPSL